MARSGAETPLGIGSVANQWGCFGRLEGNLRTWPVQQPRALHLCHARQEGGLVCSCVSGGPEGRRLSTHTMCSDIAAGDMSLCSARGLQREPIASHSPAICGECGAYTAFAASTVSRSLAWCTCMTDLVLAGVLMTVFVLRWVRACTAVSLNGTNSEPQSNKVWQGAMPKRAPSGAPTHLLGDTRMPTHSCAAPYKGV